MPAPAEAVVTLTPEMMMRAGIRTVPATAGTTTGRLHLPGVGAAERLQGGRRDRAFVSGRVTEVHAELGKRVALGDGTREPRQSGSWRTSQTTVIAARAELAAHDQRQTRAQRLFAIGAVSRQELDFLEAEGSKMGAAVESARARLILLGVPDERTRRPASIRDASATFDVLAPMAGVITKRGANPGLNVTNHAVVHRCRPRHRLGDRGPVRTRLRQGSRGKPGDDHHRVVPGAHAQRPGRLHRSPGAGRDGAPAKSG